MATLEEFGELAKETGEELVADYTHKLPHHESGDVMVSLN